MGQMRSGIFFKLIAKKLKKTPKTIEEYFIKGLIPVLLTEMARDNIVIIDGFGTFTPKLEGGCDSVQGKYIEEIITFEFKPSKECLQTLNGKPIDNWQKMLARKEAVIQQGHKFEDVSVEDIKERLYPLIENILGKKSWMENKSVLKELSQNKTTEEIVEELEDYETIEDLNDEEEDFEESDDEE